MLPGILNQLGPDSLTHLKRLATAAVPDMNADAAADDDDEVQSVYLQRPYMGYLQKPNPVK